MITQICSRRAPYSCRFFFSHYQSFIWFASIATMLVQKFGVESLHSIPTPLVSVSPTGQQRVAMIILNTPISGSPLFHQLWNQSTYKVCADGGANRIRRLELVPDVITGDLDSLTEATREYYHKRNVRILQVIDQDRNDLDKALALIDPQEYDSIVVYGATGGRLDQLMASIQELYAYSLATEKWNTPAAIKTRKVVSTQQQPCCANLFLYSDTSMACLLQPDIRHRLLLQRCDNVAETVAEGPTCGLLPVGEPVTSVTTTGLKWNLLDAPTKFGGLVSTSNKIVDYDNLTIVTSHPIVFTAETHSGAPSEWTQD